MCDRCGPAVLARYRAERLGELYLCGHCAMRLWPALAGQGWNLGLIDDAALAVRTPNPARSRTWAAAASHATPPHATPRPPRRMTPG